MRGLALVILLLMLAGCSAGLPPLPPQTRPDMQSDEAGFWQLAEKAETALRRAPTLIRDPDLNRYVRDVACKVAGPYCPDIRVYLVRAPGLNAGMQANGAMLIQSGLLLRLRDEAQLAAIIGHELGHYVERHLADKAWRARVGSDILAWVTVLGQGVSLREPNAAAALLAELQLRAFSRGQEQAADAFGLQRMAAAGYAPIAAVEIWQSAAVELGDRRASVVNRLLATHPAPAARRDGLLEEIAALPVQPEARSYVRYQAALAPHRAAFLADEVRLRLPTETLRLFQQLEEQHGLDADLAFYRGEVHRLRGWQDDQHLALRSYAEALRLPQSPAAAHRSIGLISRAQGDWQRARAAFVRYLISEPDAPDAAMVRAYIAGMTGS